MLHRTLALGALVLSLVAGTAVAQDTVKIGLILPMTGPFASTGRQIDGGGQALHGAARHHRRRQEDRGDPEGRRRHGRHHAAHRAGARGQRQGRVPRRVRPHAAGARHRADRHAGEGADGRDGGGDVDHYRYSRRSSYAPASRCRRSRARIAELGGEERHQEGRDAGHRLRSRHRRGNARSRSAFTALGGPGAGGVARAAAQSRFRAVPAARARRHARRRVRVRALRRRRDLHEAVRRARARQERHQADRHRRRHRRRHPERHGRRRAGRDHVVPLLGRARLAG